MREMTKGFMGSDVFGNRIVQPTIIMVRAGSFRAFGGGASFAAHPEGLMMREPWQKDAEGLGRVGKRSLLGQSRTEGVGFDPSAETLCSLLKKALAVSKTKVTGREWLDFFSALDRLRPLEKENGEWRASIYHQMALTCPDEVSILRSIPGAQAPTEKCVKIGVYGQDRMISTKLEPYQTRGWSIVRIPFKRTQPKPKTGHPVPYFEDKPIGDMEEIWACPPGESIPKKTPLTAKEAADLARSLGQAIGPIRSATPEAASCVKDSQADLAVTERLLDRLGKAAADGKDEPVDVTQDEVDAAKKIMDCASQLGAHVTPAPAVITGGGLSTLATAGIIGGAGAAVALLVL